MSITQRKFIRDIIPDAGLQSSKPAATPLPSGIKLTSFSPSPLPDPEPYRKLVGCLLYLTFMWPDISFAAQQLTYCDADEAGCVDSRHSLTGYCIFLDRRVPISLPIPLYCDNQAATHIVASPVFHECTKHLEIDWHVVRDHYKADFVLLPHISGHSQLVDMFTKLLPCTVFSFYLSKLGFVAFPQSHLEGRMTKTSVFTSSSNNNSRYMKKTCILSLHVFIS
ncbi:hypothetical protein Sango_0654400 [Sesamum angolense]|uniref:Uncharacterized protein n=1 Tax=Sesamum angolense TaxID=2727404 RepID=A0AAE1X704_9LAMI|nr:hypothetical protein Sango_0654400 [Sesamum angolense]